METGLTPRISPLVIGEIHPLSTTITVLAAALIPTAMAIQEPAEAHMVAAVTAEVPAEVPVEVLAATAGRPEQPEDLVMASGGMASISQGRPTQS